MVKTRQIILARILWAFLWTRCAKTTNRRSGNTEDSADLKFAVRESGLKEARWLRVSFRKHKQKQLVRKSENKGKKNIHSTKY